MLILYRVQGRLSKLLTRKLQTHRLLADHCGSQEWWLSTESTGKTSHAAMQPFAHRCWSNSHRHVGAWLGILSWSYFFIIWGHNECLASVVQMSDKSNSLATIWVLRIEVQ